MENKTIFPPKQALPQRFWIAGKRLLYVVLALLLILIAMPHGLRIGLTRLLHDAGVAKAEIENVDFNPFLGRLALRSVRLGNQGHVGLRAEKMVIAFEWWPLWQGRFKVKNLQISDGSFALRHLPKGGWRIGGIPFGVPAGANDSLEVAETATTSWGFGAETITIKNMAVSFHEMHWQEEVTLVAASFENLATWEKDESTLFSVTIARDPGTLHLAGEIKPFAAEAMLQTRLKLEGFPLTVLAPLFAADTTDKLQGVATGALAISGSYDQTQKTLHYESLDTLQLTASAYQSASTQVQSPDLTWKGSSRGEMHLDKQQFAAVLAGRLSGVPLSLKLDSLPYQFFAEELSLEGEMSVSCAHMGKEKVKTAYQANVSVYDLQVRDKAQDVNFLRLSRLTVASWQGGAGSMSMKKMAGSHVEFLERRKGINLSRNPQEYVVVVDDVVLDDVEVSDQGFISIDTVRLQNGQGLLVRNGQGEMEFGQRQAMSTKETATVAKGGGFRIGNLHLTGKNRLVYEDYFLKTPYRETFESLVFEVGLIDSRQPQLQTALSLASGVGPYGSLALAGTVTPFSIKTTMDLRGTLSSLDLPSLNPYVDQYLYYHMERGQLDAEIVFKINDGVIDSETSLLFEKLKINRVKEGNDWFQQVTGFSFQYGVDLLRDKEDNIRFRLPIKGDMQNLDFQLTDVVTKAVVASVKKAALSYYAPLGVTLVTGVTLPVGALYVSDQVLDWATTLSFKPVAFGNGSPELLVESQQYLNNIAELLGNRPKVRVVLCGKASLAELGNGGSTADIQSPGGPDDISPQDKERLLELAGNRAMQVKKYLVSQGVEAKRLILCEPGIDMETTGAPRVDISI